MGGFTGERRALAAAVLAFYSFVYLIMSLAPPPGWGACLAALAGVYGVGFFALVAGYFWARWYAIGVGISGFITAAISMWQIGPEPVLLFWGGTHVGASLVLWGDRMSKAFDGKAEWREKFHMDDSATNRLGRAVIRAGISLPYVIIYALAPREGMGDLVLVAGAGLAMAGIWGLLRMRMWSIFAMAGGAGVLISSLGDGAHYAFAGASGYAVDVSLTGVLASALLIAAVVPFVAPAVRFLRGHEQA